MAVGINVDRGVGMAHKVRRRVVLFRSVLQGESQGQCSWHESICLLAVLAVTNSKRMAVDIVGARASLCFALGRIAIKTQGSLFGDSGMFWGGPLAWPRPVVSASQEGNTPKG